MKALLIAVLSLTSLPSAGWMGRADGPPHSLPIESPSNCPKEPWRTHAQRRCKLSTSAHRVMFEAGMS
jgi:hypothetical protein